MATTKAKTSHIVRGFTRRDAETLGRVEANLDTLTEQVGELKTGMASRVDRLEREKVSYTDLAEHFTRIEKTGERMETALTTRLDMLEKHKASRQEHNEAEERTNETIRDHESRLRDLEHGRWKFAGFIAAIAAAAQFLGSKLFTKLLQ